LQNGLNLGAGLAVALPSIGSTQARAGASEKDLLETTIADLQRGLEKGAYSSRQLVERYLDRIHALDHRGPKLRSVIEINPEAFSLADTLDQERRAHKPRGPLHGVPILVKDNLDTGDRMKTSAGSLALAESVRTTDSHVVHQLRQAGALILGKTNLSEWANFRSTHSTSGWSSRGGQTRNPYVLDRNPSGSSSGSAVAVAANLTAAAIGTETDGSVISPSAANGIVGIKPTMGLVSRAGIIPIAHSQDTAGPMTRSVADAAILLGVIAGEDPDDPFTKDRARPAQTDYTSCLDPNGLKGARLGVARKFAGYNPRVDKLFEGCLSAMKRLGAEIIDPVELAPSGPYSDAEQEVLLYEFKTDLNKYLSALPANAPIHSLKDLIEFNQRRQAEVMPYFGQELLTQAEAKGPLTNRDYADARERCLKLSRTEGIDAVIKAHRLDALVAPTQGPAWLIDLVNGDSGSGSCTTPPAVAGYPHVTVPSGFVYGLPVGLSFFGGAYTEKVLIRLAYAFEQATKARRHPAFRPSVDLAAS